MAILNRFSFASIVGRPFADYLNVSTPVENSEALRESLLPVMDSIGAFQEVLPGLFQFFHLGVVKGEIKPIPEGTIKFGKRGKVATLSVSGAVLSKLRGGSLYGELLAAIGSHPHRVTMLHVTADYLVEDPALAVQGVKDAMYAGEVALTRKWVMPGQCQHVFSLDAWGKETGTCYIGQRANADVWAKVYDKRHERLSRGYSDPGKLVRVEVACMSDVGATLRDAYDPFDLFFHYAARTLCECPPEYGGWSPHGAGFVLGERRERTLWERMDRLIENSLDIRRVADMAVGLYGREVAPQALGRKIVALVPQASLAGGVIPS